MQSFLHYLTWGYLWAAAWITLQISAGALVGALVIGSVLAEARTSRIAFVRVLAALYTWVVRGTPLLLQLIFLYDALPSVGIVLNPVPTALIGFSLNQGAFFGEVIRGGKASVAKSQVLAAESLGMSPWVARRRVVMPQALRAIAPSLGNEFIALIKATSLASVISVNELTARSEFISSATFQYFPVYSAVGLMYLVMTTGVSGLQRVLERRYSLERAPAGPSMASRWLGLPARAAARASGTNSAPAKPLDANSAPAVSFPSYRPSSVAGGNAATAGGNALVCTAVWKRYQRTEVLRGLDLSVRRGEVVAIMGASGSGKSTLLRLINHLEPLDSGEILVNGQLVGYDSVGQPFRSARRLAKARADAHIGMVFQSFNLFDHMTVLDNVAAALIYVHGKDRDEAVARAADLIARVGLSGHETKLPQRLSGGQQQRIAIARSLAIDPTLMLFDEPTSALDPQLVGEVLLTIRELADQGMTMVVVTHEARFAAEVANRLLFVSAGQVIEQGPPDEVLGNPRHPETQRFFRSLSYQSQDT